MYKTKDRVTRTSLKPGGELMCSDYRTTTVSTVLRMPDNSPHCQLAPPFCQLAPPLVPTRPTFIWSTLFTFECSLSVNVE